MSGKVTQDIAEKATHTLKMFRDLVEDALDDEEIIALLAKEYRAFTKNLEEALLPPSTPIGSEIRKGAQSKQFMMQIAPYVQNYMRKQGKGARFDILDVGSRTGHGSNLLASLYQTMELGYRARVTAIDIDPTYHHYARFFCRYIVHRVATLESIQRSYDIVIASHVIEHVEDPFAFVEQLRNVCHGLTIICAPYNESNEFLTEGHLRVIDDEFLAQLGATHIDFMESPAWGQFMSPRYKMFVACLKGSALPPQVAKTDSKL